MLTIIRQVLLSAWRCLRGPTAAEADAIWAQYEAAIAAADEYDAAQREPAVRAVEEPDPSVLGYLAWRVATPELAEGEYAPGYRAARDVEPYTTIMHPDPGAELPTGEYDPREVLEVVAVDVHEEKVTFTCASGPPVTVVEDWPIALDSPADADHRALVLLDAVLDEPGLRDGGAATSERE